MLTETRSLEELLAITEGYRQARGADAGLGVSVVPDGERQDVLLVMITPERTRKFARPYGGPPEYASRWAFHHSLDVLRRSSSPR